MGLEDKFGGKLSIYNRIVRRIKPYFLVLPLALSFYSGCSEPDGCKTDYDCKQGRACVDGGCILTGNPIKEQNPSSCADSDSDGFYATANCATLVDCDDQKENVYPGAEEECDELDNDCDGKVDEDNVCNYGCEPHHHLACRRGDLYWEDSCNRKEEIDRECETNCKDDYCCEDFTLNKCLEESVYRTDLEKNVFGTTDACGRTLSEDGKCNPNQFCSDAQEYHFCYDYETIGKRCNSNDDCGDETGLIYCKDVFRSFCTFDCPDSEDFRSCPDGLYCYPEEGVCVIRCRSDSDCTSGSCQKLAVGYVLKGCMP